MPRSEPVPYGEIPFDHSRLDVLRDVLSKLEAQGFHGVVKITSLAGLFCLSGNATDGFAPAGATLPANKCDLIGNPFEESLSGQQRQSLAFANLVAGIRQRTSGAITVDLRECRHLASPRRRIRRAMSRSPPANGIGRPPRITASNSWRSRARRRDPLERDPDEKLRALRR